MKTAGYGSSSQSFPFASTSPSASRVFSLSFFQPLVLHPPVPAPSRVEMIFARLVLCLSALLLSTLVTALPLVSRQSAIGVATCTDRATQLVSHDCNVALLSLGGGIAGAIQFLRVNSASTTATSGTCKVTATAIDGGQAAFFHTLYNLSKSRFFAGTIIDISKGRLEGNGRPNGGFVNLIDACGTTPGTMVIGGGTNNGGNILISIEKA
ncbi:hypothetical protein MKEN_00974300 [Mycena kentingensis (nom. inval.)]|nr:hypothetical protein MKEN_00974300 [Mycena kentingensis (nom. inval.)]